MALVYCVIVVNLMTKTVTNSKISKSGQQITHASEFLPTISSSHPPRSHIPSVHVSSNRARISLNSEHPSIYPLLPTSKTSHNQNHHTIYLYYQNTP